MEQTRYLANLDDRTNREGTSPKDFHEKCCGLVVNLPTRPSSQVGLEYDRIARVARTLGFRTHKHKLSFIFPVSRDSFHELCVCKQVRYPELSRLICNANPFSYLPSTIVRFTFKKSGFFEDDFYASFNPSHLEDARTLFEKLDE